MNFEINLDYFKNSSTSAEDRYFPFTHSKVFENNSNRTEWKKVSERIGEIVRDTEIFSNDNAEKQNSRMLISIFVVLVYYDSRSMCLLNSVQVACTVAPILL